MAPFEDRAVSEGASVAVLVLLTVFVTASVGLGVLVADRQGETVDAEFSYQHFPDREALLVTFEEGETLQAGTVQFRGPGQATWAELSDIEESDPITPGSRVQLTESNAFGAGVTEDTNVTVVRVQGDNETVIDTWSG